MGAGIWPSFRPQVAGIHPQLDGRVLLQCFDELDALALDVGVAEFSAFGNEPVDDQDKDAEEGTGEDETRWYDPAEGLRTISALIAALEAPGAADPRSGSPFEDIVRELRELERCLTLAARAGARFRLEVLD
jgi:hypothetical protein